MQSLLFGVSVACDGPSGNRGGLCSPCRQNNIIEVRRSFRCAAQAQAVETLPPLSAWVEQRGLPLRKLHVRPEKVDGELSLVTSQPTKKGQPLVAVPSSAWLTQQVVRTSSIGPLVKDLDAWLQIALFLLHERSQPDAAWQGFLDSIPAQPDVPLFWTEDELAQLEGTQLLSSVQAYRYGHALLTLQRSFNCISRRMHASNLHAKPWTDDQGECDHAGNFLKQNLRSLRTSSSRHIDMFSHQRFIPWMDSFGLWQPSDLGSILHWMGRMLPLCPSQTWCASHPTQCAHMI